MVRYAVYTDYVYHHDGDAVYADRAFALFVAEVARLLEGLVVVGRLDPRPGGSHYRLPGEVRLLALPYYPTLSRPRQAAPALARALRRFWHGLSDVDAVWLLGPFLLSLAFAAMAAARRKPVVLGVRQDLPRYVRSRHPRRFGLQLAALALEAAYRLLARRCPTVVVGPDLALRYRHARRLLAIDVSLVRDRDLHASARNRRPDWDGRLQLLSVGRLDREKNPLLLADVLAALRRSDPRWTLVVCGEGPMRDALQQRLDELGLSRHAELRGFVPHDRGLLAVYAKSHVFLHVSRTEGLPQVLIEAFGMRVPVVATAVGGVPLVAQDRALLVPPDDAAAAARAVSSLAHDRGLRARLVESGLAYARDHTLEREAARVASFLSAAETASTSSIR